MDPELKRRLAKERQRIRRARLKHAADTKTILGIVEITAPAETKNPNRFDVNNYRGSPDNIRHIGLIKKRKK